MKKLIVLLGCLFIIPSYFSQINTTRVSIINEKRDTLFLAKTELGYSIHGLWNYPYKIKPVIIFKSKQWITERTYYRNRIKIKQR